MRKDFERVQAIDFQTEEGLISMGWVYTPMGAVPFKAIAGDCQIFLSAMGFATQIRVEPEVDLRGLPVDDSLAAIATDAIREFLPLATERQRQSLEDRLNKLGSN